MPFYLLTSRIQQGDANSFRIAIQSDNKLYLVISTLSVPSSGVRVHKYRVNAFSLVISRRFLCSKHINNPVYRTELIIVGKFEWKSLMFPNLFGWCTVSLFFIIQKLCFVLPFYNSISDCGLSGLLAIFYAMEIVLWLFI